MERVFYPGDVVCRPDGLCGRVVAANGATALVRWRLGHELVPLGELELADQFADQQLRNSLGEPLGD